jgi:hypothetical protein
MLANSDTIGIVNDSSHFKYPSTLMAFFRQYIAPLFIFLIFFIALAAASARAFLPSDMAQPAPIEVPSPSVQQTMFNPGLEQVEHG